MRVGWLVQSERFDVASVRYRCYYPAYGLSLRGHENRIFDDVGAATEAVHELDVLIIVKRLDTRMIGLAARVREAGVLLILDLCDDVFSPGYRGEAPELNLLVLGAIGVAADLIVTTGEPLSERIRNSLPLWTPTFEIADLCETPELVAEAELFYGFPHLTEAPSEEPKPMLGRVKAGLSYASRHPIRAARRAVGTVLRLKATTHVRKGLGRLWYTVRHPSWLSQKISRAWRRSSIRARAGMAVGRVKYAFTHPDWLSRRLVRAISRLLQSRIVYVLTHPVWAMRNVRRRLVRSRPAVALSQFYGRSRYCVAHPGWTLRKGAHGLASSALGRMAGRVLWRARRPGGAAKWLVRAIYLSPVVAPFRMIARRLLGRAPAGQPAPLRAEEQPLLNVTLAPIAETPPEPAPATPVIEARPKVVWFGNHGGPHSNFGMLSLLAVASELGRVKADHDFELVVISNDHRKFEAISTVIDVPTRYVAWTTDAVFRELADASVALLTSGDDRFSRVKSSNRALLALGAGVPVVAPRFPGLRQLEDVVATDVEAGLRRYLSDREAAAADVAKAQALIEANYSLGAITERWDTALQDVTRRAARRQARRCEHPKLLFLFDLIQDLNILLPVVDAARRRGLSVNVIITEHAAKFAPRTMEALIERRLIPTFLSPSDLPRLDARWLRNADIVVTAAESSFLAHKTAHTLTNLANRQGLRTASIQHGYEMPGLTLPHEPPVEFASQCIFTWHEPAQLPPGASNEILSRCIGVGRPRLRTSRISNESADGVTIGVFENLHWDRYSGDYRRSFLDHLCGAAEEHPGFTFVVRTHPAGKWFLDNAPKKLTPNIHIVGRANPGALPPVEEFLNRVSAVITTPSTVAADACEAGLPTAVVGGDLEDLSRYHPLPLLRSQEDWLRFLAFKSADEGLLRQSFLSRVVLPGDGSETILDYICSERWPPQANRTA